MKRKTKYNYILAIETSNNICGVAISINNKIRYESNLNLGLNHSITLFENINKGLSSLNIDFSKIDLIKVSAGPGSFTGIRIGIATALGLSIAYNTPIEYIDTLDSLCHNNNFKKKYIVSMIDAKSERVYLSLYENYTYKKIIKDTIVNINDLKMLLCKHFKNYISVFQFVGNGAYKYKDILTNGKNVFVTSSDFELKASSLILSCGKISSKPFINYILASKAERDYNDKH